MKIILSLIIFPSIILESTFIPYPLTFFVVILLQLFFAADMIILSFLSGLILDSFSARPLGSSSLLFLALNWIGERYQKKLYEGSIIYRIIFMSLSLIIYSVLFYGRQKLEIYLIYFVVTSFILIFLSKFFPNLGTKRKITL